MSIVPFAKLSFSTINYFVLSSKAQYLGTQVLDIERLKYSEAIGMKIIPNLKCPQLQITINQCFVSTHQDGFNMLKTIFEIYIPWIRKPHTPSAYVEQTAHSTFRLKSNTYTFPRGLNLYYETKALYDRTYTEMEKTNVFIGAIANDTQYTKAALDIRNLLPREIGDNVPPEYGLGHIVDIICNHSSVEKDYRLGHIADTICSHSSVETGVGLDAFYGEATQLHIRSTEASYDDTEATIHQINGKRKETKKATCTVYYMQAIRP